MWIYLARHGETPGNANRVIQTPETPLSECGVAQAERLGRRLAQAGVVRVLSSDLPRAALTAEHVRRATGAPLELDPLLQERNFGELRGTPYAQLGLDPFAPDYAPPGGESWEVFHARVDAAWRRVLEVAAATPGDLAVVTHGLVCYSLALRHWTLPDGPPLAMRMANTAVSEVESAAPHRVRVLACAAHLDETASISPA